MLISKGFQPHISAGPEMSLTLGARFLESHNVIEDLSGVWRLPACMTNEPLPRRTEVVGHEPPHEAGELTRCRYHGGMRSLASRDRGDASQRREARHIRGESPASAISSVRCPISASWVSRMKQAAVRF